MISESGKGPKIVSSRMWGKEVLGGGLRRPSERLQQSGRSQSTCAA